MADYFELLQTRRSIRDFEDTPVKTEVVLELIRESTLAANSGNGQPWTFIVVNNKELIKRISDDSKATLVRVIDNNPDHFLKKYEDVLRSEDFNVFYNAPCLVLFCGPESVGSLPVDTGLAASYFMLSASARGLGTTWIGLGGNVTDEGLLAEIGLPEGQRIVAPIIVGYPKEIPPIPERNEPVMLKIIE